MKYITTILATIAVSSTAAFAQQQESSPTKEIVIEKDYVPVEQKATRIALAPSVVRLQPSRTQPSFSYRTFDNNNTGYNDIATLVPYGYRTTKLFGAPRGYVDFAMGSYLNIDGSAGYRLIDTKNTILDIWAQHSSSWGMHNNVNVNYEVYTSGTHVPSTSYLEYDGYTQAFTQENLGADLAQKFRHGTLTASVDYLFNRQRLWYAGTLSSVTKFNNRNYYNISARYDGSPANDIYTFYVGADFNRTANNINSSTKEIPTATQSHVQVVGGATAAIDDQDKAGIDLAIDNLSSSLRSKSQTTESDKATVIKVSPYYQRVGEKGSFTLGVNGEFSFNDGAFLRISPRASGALTVTNGVTLFGTATGGKSLNCLADIYALNGYSAPTQFYSSSFTPIDTKAGVKLGSFKGFTATAYVGYNKTKNALQWDITAQTSLLNSEVYPEYGNLYNRKNRSGFMCGIDLNYVYSRYIDATFSIKHAKQSLNNGYSFGFDRPDWVLNITLASNPIDKLHLQLALDSRNNRHLKALINSENLTVIPVDFNLHAANNLSFSGSYDINRMVSVNIRASNILNRKWLQSPYYRAQGLALMAGVALKLY